VLDNCILLFNDQSDVDDDGLGDACQDPGLSNLTGQVGSNKEALLTWNGDGKPVLGYTVYRFSDAEPTPVYLGSTYPSTAEPEFTESPGPGGVWTYLVFPVDLLGREAEGASVEIAFEISEDVFEDGFENPGN